MAIKKAEEIDEESVSTECRYHLTCKVVKKRMSYRDHQSRNKEGNETAEVILLVPEQTTEASCFFRAWLPDESEKLIDQFKREMPACSEVGILADFPIAGFMRAALFRGNNLLPQPHLFVMSHRAEKILSGHIGKKFRFTVLGEREFDEAYEAKAETRNPYD